MFDVDEDLDGWVDGESLSPACTFSRCQTYPLHQSVNGATIYFQRGRLNKLARFWSYRADCSLDREIDAWKFSSIRPVDMGITIDWRDEVVAAAYRVDIELFNTLLSRRIEALGGGGVGGYSR